jgi:hypothetical protein
MLNKQQMKIAQMAIQHANNGNISAAARVLSGLYRCALKQSQRKAIIDLANTYSLVSNSDFVI